MSERSEFLDHSFRPGLKKIVAGDTLEYFKITGIKLAGRPAPTLNERKAAVWAGTKPDTQGEVPILAVTIPRENSFISDDTNWHVGYLALGHKKELVRAMDSVAPVQAVLLAHAEYGPFSTIWDAIRLLTAIHPR